VAGSATGGGVSASPGWSKQASVAVGPAGEIVVAWADDTSGNYEIRLKRFGR